MSKSFVWVVQYEQCYRSLSQFEHKEGYVKNIRIMLKSAKENIYFNSRITIVTQARETPSFLANAALVPIRGSLTIFWYFKASSCREIRFFNFFVLILWRRWPRLSGNSVVKKFEFRTDEGSAKPILYNQ